MYTIITFFFKTDRKLMIQILKKRIEEVHRNKRNIRSQLANNDLLFSRKLLYLQRHMRFVGKYQFFCEDSIIMHDFFSVLRQLQVH